MKKQFTRTLVPSLLAIFLVACQQSTTSDSKPVSSVEEAGSSVAEETASSVEETTSTVEETAEDSSVKEFENVILMDDENVTVELVNYYVKPTNWSEGARDEKCITFKVKNKSDRKILFDLRDAYIGDEAVWICLLDGNAGPKPGKSGNYGYYIDYDTSPNKTELESLDKLNELEGSFEICIFSADESKIENRYNYDFAIQDVLSGEAGAAEETESHEISEEEIKDIITNVSQWSYTDNTGNVGYTTFYSDGKCYFDAGHDMVFEDATWEFNEEHNIHVSFEMDGKAYGATYSFVDNNGKYELHNVQHPEAVWTPVE